MQRCSDKVTDTLYALLAISIVLTVVSVLVPLPDGIKASIKVSVDGPGGQSVRIAWSDGVKAEVKPADAVKP